MLQAESGDAKSSKESLSLDPQAGYVISRKKSYDMDPESPAGSGDEEEYLEEHQRTVTSSFLQRSLAEQNRSSIDSNGSSAGASSGNVAGSSSSSHEQASDRFGPRAAEAAALESIYGLSEVITGGTGFITANIPDCC
ncbi:hypothetical protein CPC16_011784 [Podila verticillata]|nr:hypothetical protein CPC16_011784 [Podila verticillata]